MLLPEKTVSYKTYVKTALVEALSRVFNSHVDSILRGTQVGIGFPTAKTDYPATIVRFFERTLRNAGVGHEELLTTESGIQRFKHYLYDGDIEFAIYTLSSLDRDLIADSLVETITMGDLEDYTNSFFTRIYNSDESEVPISAYHYINLNSDNVQGFGETQVQAPWEPEDTLVFQTAYRIGIFGEFYSLPPTETLKYIEEVDIFPYTDGESVPIGNPSDPAPWT